MEESDMLHESDHEHHSEQNDMGEDADFDDAVLWGEEDGSEDDSGEDNQDNEMESDEEGQDIEPDVPPQFFNADGRPVHLWNLGGQLGALPEFVRMTAGLLLPQGGGRERTNEDLVRSLKRHSNITCKEVIKAFQVCPRDVFVPEDQQDEAFEDTPLRLDREFNISAPHMHGCMIQGLKIQPGDHCLDVGSGCGATTAMMAFLAGKEGRVVGVELRQYALNLSRDAMAKMRKNKEFVSRACEPTFEQGNAFILPDHEGKFDKVHIGGLCDLHKLPVLMKLLKPGTGRLVVPCDNKLFCITRTGSKIEREVLLDVRFGELITPNDAEIALGHLDHHRERLLMPEEHPSRYEEEMAAAIGRPVPHPRTGNASAGTEDGEDLDVRSSCTCGSFGFSPTRSLMGRTSLSSSGSPPSFPPCLFLPRTSSPGSPSALPTLPPYVTHGPPNPVALAHALGPADCTVCGAGFNLPVHSTVLQARCPVMHAQFTSGMRDAEAREVTLPPHFAEGPVRAALDYMYSDKVSLDEETALPTLALAVYLNMSHLVSLVSHFIVEHLREEHVPEAVESAVQLHIFASEQGLEVLRRFCAAFLAVHITEARKAPSYKTLGVRELDEVRSTPLLSFFKNAGFLFPQLYVLDRPV